MGTLPAVATAAAPSYTEGNQVALSVDLDGNLRTSGAGGGLTEPVDTESADGAHATLGTTTDAGVTTDTSGTVIGFLRGIVIQLGNILTALAGTINVLHPQPSTATRSSVAASETVVTILAANSSRLGATVFHDGGGARRLWLALGSGAAETDYTVELRGGDYFQIPFNYRGVITGVWNNDGGSNTFARVTELT